MNIGKFILNVIVAFVAYGALYTGGTMMFADQFAAAMEASNPESIGVLVYHLVQTVVVVWLFNKAVGSGDMKAGAVFGTMIGLYLLASDAVWFSTVKDFPGDARMVLGVMHLVVGAIVGMLLAFMQGKGWGSSAIAAETPD